MNDEVKKYYQTGSMVSYVLNIMLDDDINPIKDILFANSNSSYNLLTQQEKEQQIFCAMYREYLLDETNEHFLRYMIFDYNISEENSIHNITDLNDTVKNMFENRKLNVELNSELNIQANISKKAKI
jgi:hypothetical protein